MENSFVKNISVWGDSILKGVIYDEVKKKYLALKDNAVSILGKNLSFSVKNNSRFGCTASKALKNLGNAIKKGLKADMVLLEFGGNDCDRDWVKVSADPEKEHKPKTPLPDFRKYMTEMIELLIENKIKPILMNLPPINGQIYFEWVSKLEGVKPDIVLKWLGTPYSMYRQQELYSLEIERIAQKNNIPFIDVRDKLLNNIHFDDYLCVDGIHLNKKGQAYLGKLISDGMMQFA